MQTTMSWSAWFFVAWLIIAFAMFSGMKEGDGPRIVWSAVLRCAAPLTPLLFHQPLLLAVSLPSATLLHHSKCALMKLYFSTKQGVITFCDSCKQEWDQKFTFENPEGTFSCREVHDTIWRVAQHLVEVLRFTDDEVVFCSTYKQFCYYWGRTFDLLEFGKPNQNKCLLIPAWAQAWWHE